MPTQAPAICPDCSYENEEGLLSCSLCGSLLRRPGLPPTAHAASPPVRAILQASAGPQQGSGPAQVLGLSEHWFYLALGAAIAPIFVFTPFLRLMGWFLTSLFHESGHCLFAWAFGMPSIPAISLAGHAAAFHQAQVPWLAVAVWVLLAALAFRCRRSWPWLSLFLAATIGYPLLAFFPAREFVFLVGGHLGELGFATVFFWRALSGGFTQNSLERTLYAVLAWYLLACNVWLCAGLSLSIDFQHWYASRSSFGLTNDYIRLANDVLGWPLGGVAVLMLLVSLTPLPIALWIWRSTAITSGGTVQVVSDGS